jgi:hypothetical protein
MYKHHEKISRARLIFNNNLFKNKNYEKHLPQKFFRRVIFMIKLFHHILIRKIYGRIQKISQQISVKIGIFYILSLKFYGKLFYHLTDVKGASMPKNIEHKKFLGLKFFVKIRLFFNYTFISSKRRLGPGKKESTISSSSYRKFKMLHFCYSQNSKKLLPNFKKQYLVGKNLFPKGKTYKKKKLLNYLDFFGKNKLKNEKSLLPKPTDKLNNFSELKKFNKNISYIFEKSNHFFGKSFKIELIKNDSKDKFDLNSFSMIGESNFFWLSKGLLIKNKENLKIKRKNHLLIGKKKKSGNEKKRKTDEFGIKFF